MSPILHAASLGFLMFQAEPCLQAALENYFKSIGRCTFGFKSAVYVPDPQGVLPDGVPARDFRATVGISSRDVVCQFAITSRYFRHGQLNKVDYSGENFVNPPFSLGIAFGSDDSLRLLLSQESDERLLYRIFMNRDFLVPTLGILPRCGGISLLDMLAQVTPTEIEQDKARNTIRAQTRHGRLEILLDPSQGYAPKQVTLVKDPHSLLDDEKPLSSFDHWKSPVDSLTIEVHVTSYLPSPPAGVPGAFTVQSVWKLADGREIVQRSGCQVQDFVVLAPEAPLTIATPIPNGTPVTVKGAEQIQHIWLDGKVVKVVDQSVVADLSGQRFQQSRAYWTVLAVLGLFVLVLGTVYLYVRRRGPSAVA